MTRINEAKSRCKEITDKLYANRADFAAFLKFSGSLYKMPSANAMQVYGLNPQARMISTYNGWQNLNRHVNRGESSMAILTADGKLLHYFDINQTDGDTRPVQWSIDRNISSKLVRAISEELGSKKKKMFECIDALAEKIAKQNAVQVASELGVRSSQRDQFLKSYISMITSVIVARCSINSEYKYRGNENFQPDLSAVDLCKDKSDFLRLASYVQQSAKSAILSIEQNVRKIYNEQRSENYATGKNHLQDRERNENVLLSGRTEILPGDQDGRENGGSLSARSEDVDVSRADSGNRRSRGNSAAERTDRDLWTEVAGVYGNELSTEDPGIAVESSLGAHSPTDRTGSGGDDLRTGEQLHGKEPDPEKLLGESSLLQDDESRNFGDHHAGDRSSTEGIAEKIIETAEASVEASAFLRDVREGEQLRFSPEPLDQKQQRELEQLTRHLEQEYDRWERIYLDGGSDAFYEDGIGLELTRNHIMYEKRQLFEKYPNHLPEVYSRELPPEMSRKYQSVKKGDTLRLENGDFIVVEIAEKSPYTGDYSVTLQGENGDLSVRDLRNIKTRFRNLTNHGEAPTYEITSAGFAIPSDLEKYYVNRENESLTSVYFNPDSDAGGQFVYKHFSFDELLKAMDKPDPLDELESISHTELVDIDTANFKESARKFLKKDEDFNNRDTDVLAELTALIEPYRPPTVTAYKVGDFYEFYGSDAKTTADLLNLTQTTRHGVLMTGIPSHTLKDFAEKLAAQGISITNRFGQGERSYTVENAKGVLIEYAERRILYYNGTVRKAFLSGNRTDFNEKVQNAVRSAVSETINDELDMAAELSKARYGIEGDVITGTSKKDFIALYLAMERNPEFSEALYEEIADRLYALHTEVDKGRQMAHEFGIPYDEYPYDPEEEFNPYLYDPNRMSDEDYERMHELIAEDLKSVVEVKIPFTENGLLRRFLDEHYPEKNPPFALANAMFNYLDKKFSTENDGGYDKTDFELTVHGLDNGEDYSYNGRFDIGDGETLIKHISDYNRDITENKTGFYSDTDVSQAKQTLQVLIPTLVKHDGLSAEEQSIFDEFKKQNPIQSKAVIDEAVETSQERRTNAFKKLKANHDFKPETMEFLDRIERQMNINNYDVFELKMLRLPIFQHNYGLLPRISEKVFDGKLKEIAAELNEYLASAPSTVMIEQTDPKENPSEEKSHSAFADTTPEVETTHEQMTRNVTAAELSVGDNSDGQYFGNPEKEVVSPSANDFHITDENYGVEGGAKAKFQANVDAIKLLQQLEAETRMATPDEQRMLARYSGWGGLSQAFEQNNSAWGSEYTELRNLLTTEEYESARASTLNAHYTSPVIIEAMYQALGNFGFQGGKILEPSMGIGNFLGKIPEEMRPNSHFSGIELDSISGRIAKQLYPNADISIMGFEKKNIPDNTYDVAIGNIPFGNYGLSDPAYNKHNFLIHDYFFAKSLDKVAPGGIVAFVSSKGTLDKQSVAFREYLADRADLVGAIRLPNNAFKEAGTGVTSDIIFLKKRTDPPIEKPDWVFTAENESGIPINQYFINHPEMILGKMEMVSGRFGEEAACIPNSDESLKEQLDRAVSNLKAQITVDRQQQREQEMRGVIPAAPNVRNFTFASIDGKIYFRENDIMKEVKLSVQQAQCVQGLIGIRQSLRELMDAQVNGCTDDELSDYQKQLDVLYEKFVQKYGHINGNKISTIFREDDDFNLLCALEIVNSETKEITKSEIFTDRTIKADIIVDHAETAEEALQISMDLRGKVDIAYMADLVGTEKDSIISELTKNDLIFLNPAKISENVDIYEAYEECSEYLSGNIREKLDGIAFQEVKYAQNPDMLKTVQHNKAALEAVLPPTIAAGDIKAEIGVNWVDPSDYEQFIAEHSGLDLRSVSKYTPLRRTLSGEYKIENKNYFNTRIGVTTTAGTKRVNSFKILENLLNKRDVVVKDVVYDHGEVKSVINKKETDLAQEKARQMKEAFSKWIFADPSRREKYVEKYNRLFNSIVGRHYDGSKQTFPGMSPDIALRPHQKDAIARAKLGGNTLLAHAVGAGKSFEMVAATMERKRLGLINKACVVVPKHLVGQTALEWQRLYPNAHLLTATEKDFTKDNRKKFVGRCVTGNYDAVIMSYEQFEKIPMSDSYRVEFLEREINEVMDGLDDARSEGNKNSVKDLERKKKELERKLNKLLESGKTKDNAVNFEQLGFDYLVVDEAHNYKNGLVITKMTNVSGVQSTPAQKSEDILMKCQYLNEKTGYKGILFATGTPISNSMVELYTMQRYLRPDLLQKAELYTFDDWASNFGEVVSQLELKPAGDGFRTKKRFAKFNNLPELMQMYKEFADIKTAESLNLPVPNIIGGKAQTVVAKPDDFQKAYIQSLAERSERIQSGSVDPSEDNMLKITHEARLLGLDSRAINPDAENRPDSKVNLCIDNIMKIYHDTDEQKGVQIVFCDIAVHADPENGKWSVYDNIKQELIKRGIPEEEICFAGDVKNQAERNEMYAQLRSGTKRLVISSTQKMGTGANVQTRLAALHHLDIPWKPSDLEQQNGRILRQGNQFSDVGIYHYVTEETFDAYMLSIITTKQRFISQTMSGDVPGRSCSDVDEMVLNYSEMQAIATGDPRIKEKIELDGEVAKLRVLESEHFNTVYRMQDSLPHLRDNLDREKRILECCKADLADRNKELASMPKDDFAGMKIDGIMFRERKAAGAAMRPLIYKVINNEAEKCTVGEYGGFTIGLEKLKNVDQHCRLFITGSSGIKYFTTDIEMASDTGNVQRIENLFRTAIEKKIAATEENLVTDTQNLKDALETIQKPFDRAAKLQEKSAQLEQLNRELNVDRADEQFIANDEEDQDQPDRGQEQEIKRSKPKR